MKCPPKILQEDLCILAFAMDARYMFTDNPLVGRRSIDCYKEARAACTAPFHGIIHVEVFGVENLIYEP